MLSLAGAANSSLYKFEFDLVVDKLLVYPVAISFLSILKLDTSSGSVDNFLKDNRSII